MAASRYLIPSHGALDPATGQQARGVPGAMDPGLRSLEFVTLEAKGQKTFTSETANVTKKKAAQKEQRSRSSFLAQRNILGFRISHAWKEDDVPITQWRETVVDQVAVNPSLYLVKYDRIDCVYGLELHKDRRILSLKIVSDAVKPFQVSDPSLVNTIIGRAVAHLFEGEQVSKDAWKGMVLGQAPVLDAWFYITYEKDPIVYLYQLLDDYKEGDVRIIPQHNEVPPLDVSLEFMDGVLGKHVQYTKDDGSKRVGMVIHKVECNPSLFFIKFDDYFHIYVYKLEKNY